MAPYVKKGDRIRATWLKAADPPSSLAGMQLKFSGEKFEVQGVIRHVRGDHPTNPTVVRFYVDPEHDFTGPRVRPYGCTCPTEHVEVNPDHVTAHLT